MDRPAPPANIDEFLASYNESVRLITLYARTLIVAAMPGAIERVNSGHKTIIYSRGARMADEVLYLAPFRAHVNLGFLCGTELADPERLLEGIGKRLRHVKLRTVADVERPAVRALIAVAVAYTPEQN